MFACSPYLLYCYYQKFCPFLTCLLHVFYCMMDERYIQVSWHYGGPFVRESGLKYVGGYVTVKNMDCDKLSVPELLWYVRYFGYIEASSVYYKPTTGNHFILLHSYVIILEVAKKFKDGDKVDLCIGHVVSVPILARDPNNIEV